MRIRDSVQLKTLLELYDMENHQKKWMPNFQKLKTIVKRSFPFGPKTNSNDFGGFWNYLADSISNFVVAKFFLNDSNFWCFQSPITFNETVHVHVLWLVCTHTIPFRMLWCP